MLASSPRYTFRLLFSFTLSLLLFCAFAQSAWACDPPIESNYWYKLTYDISSDLLPPDIDVAITYPTYDEDVYQSAVGRVEFINNSTHALYILPSAAIYRVDQYREHTGSYAEYIVTLHDAFDQNVPAMALAVLDTGAPNTRAVEPGATGITYGNDSAIADDLHFTLDIPQSPGGVAEPSPAPSEYDLVLLHNDQFYRVPLTITYTLNPDYDENKILFNAPLSDRMILSDKIIKGEIIGAAPGSQLVDFSYNGVVTDTYVTTVAHIAVEEWVYGEGPDEIYVGNFVEPGFSCGGEIKVGTSTYLILKETETDTPNSNDIPRFNHYGGIDQSVGNSREQIASALLTAKGLLLDPVISIMIPLWQRE